MRPLLLLLGAVCYAQTAIQVDQIQAPAATGVRVLTVGADGKPAWAALGPGLELRGGQIVATAIGVPSASISQLRLTAASDGSYIVTPGAAWYTRNGLALVAGEDYKIEAGRLIPLAAWAVGSTVIQWQFRVNGDPVAFVGLREELARAGLK